MANLRQRLDRLENTMSPKYYLWVGVAAGESRGHALERTCKEAGITPERVGAAVFFGDTIKTVAYDRDVDVTTLAGYRSYEDLLRDLQTTDHQQA